MRSRLDRHDCSRVVLILVVGRREEGQQLGVGAWHEVEAVRHALKIWGKESYRAFSQSIPHLMSTDDQIHVELVANVRDNIWAK